MREEPPTEAGEGHEPGTAKEPVSLSPVGCVLVLVTAFLIIPNLTKLGGE